MDCPDMVQDDALMQVAARRAQRTALARALQKLGLMNSDWLTVNACPSWLVELAPACEEGESAHADTGGHLCLHAGGWWLAAALHACIDGKRLACACALLGEATLDGLRAYVRDQRTQGAADAMPNPLLPPAHNMQSHLLACGRALLAWDLRPSLRAPLLTCLGWSVDEGHYTVFDAHAVWARQALRMAHQSACASVPIPVSVPASMLAPETE